MLQTIKNIGLLIMVGYFSQTLKAQRSLNISEDVSGNSFASFLSHFPKAETPYEINLEVLINIMDPKLKTSRKNITSLNWNRKLMGKYMPTSRKLGFMRRSGPPVIEPIARIYQGDKYISVLFSKRQFFGAKNAVSIGIITYDLNGNIVTLEDGNKNQFFTQVVASNNGQESMTCLLLGDGQVETIFYNNQWEKDVNKHGYKNNKILRRQRLGSGIIQLIPEKEDLVSNGR